MWNNQNYKYNKYETVKTINIKPVILSKKLFIQLRSLEIFLERNAVTFFFKKTKAYFPHEFLKELGE